MTTAAKGGMKILVAEDDTASRLVLSATLRKLGHEVVAVADGAAALAAWEHDEYPLLISDWMMPELDGPTLCRAIRAQTRQHYTYLLLLTSLEGKGNYLAGMDAGADDFLTKPFDEDLLVARLRVARRILDLHESLRIEATHDRLTGVWNRGAILDSLQLELQRSAREGRGGVGVLMVDIDHFKPINDTHGHLVGDIILRETARRMQSALRRYDRLGRFGGEEFVVVLSGNDLDQALMVAERIRQAIAGSPFQPSPDAAPIEITISLGAAVADASQSDPLLLLGAADRALYRAKRNGRNRVELERELAPAPTL